jgi:hypothetical protein
MQLQSNDDEVMLEVTIKPVTGVYWGPLAPLTAKSAHEMLLTAIQGRPGVELFTATAFNRASDTPCACFDIAIDAKTGDGCGVFRTIIIEAGGLEPHDIATPALWYQYDKPEDIVAKVHKHLNDLKFFENFYAHVEAALDQVEEECSRLVH